MAENTSTNLGLNMFLSAFGRNPESQSEIDFIDQYNTNTNTQQSSTGNQIDFPATAVDPQLNAVAQQRQEFSTPNVFLSFLKTGLNAKLQPQQEQLGTSPLYEAAGLTGMPTLMQSLGARQDQLIRSGADLAKVLQTSSGIYGDYYNLLDNQYKELTTKQNALIEQQWKVEDDLRNFNQSLYMVQRQEELKRESDDLQAKLDVWKNQQTTATGLAADKELYAYKSDIDKQTSAWEEALARETYAYQSGVDIEEYAQKAGIDSESEAFQAALKAQTPNTQIITANGEVQLVDKNTGEVVKNFGSAYKEGTTGTAGTAATPQTGLEKAVDKIAQDIISMEKSGISSSANYWSQVNAFAKKEGIDAASADKIIIARIKALKGETGATGATGTTGTQSKPPSVIPKTKSELQAGVAYKFPDSNKVYQWTGSELKWIPDETAFKQIYGGLPEENTNYITVPGSYNNFMNESNVNTTGTITTNNGWTIKNGKATKTNETFNGVPEKKLEVSVPQENMIFRTDDTSPIQIMKNGQIYTLSPEDVLGTQQEKDARGNIVTMPKWSGSNNGEQWNNYLNAVITKLGISKNDIKKFNSADLVSVFGNKFFSTDTQTKINIDEIKRLFNS